jgi:hypothetical protein
MKDRLTDLKLLELTYEQYKPKPRQFIIHTEEYLKSYQENNGRPWNPYDDFLLLSCVMDYGFPDESDLELQKPRSHEDSFDYFKVKTFPEYRSHSSLPKILNSTRWLHSKSASENPNTESDTRDNLFQN